MDSSEHTGWCGFEKTDAAGDAHRLLMQADAILACMRAGTLADAIDLVEEHLNDIDVLREDLAKFCVTVRIVDFAATAA